MLQPVLKQQEVLCILLHGATDTSAITEASPLAIGKWAELMEGGSDWKSHFSVMVYFLNLILGEFGEDDYTAYEQQYVSTIHLHANYKCLDIYQIKEIFQLEDTVIEKDFSPLSDWCH